MYIWMFAYYVFYLWLSPSIITFIAMFHVKSLAPLLSAAVSTSQIWYYRPSCSAPLSTLRKHHWPLLSIINQYYPPLFALIRHSKLTDSPMAKCISHSSEAIRYGQYQRLGTVKDHYFCRLSHCEAIVSHDPQQWIGDGFLAILHWPWHYSAFIMTTLLVGRSMVCYSPIITPRQTNREGGNRECYAPQFRSKGEYSWRWHHIVWCSHFRTPLSLTRLH